MRSLTVFFAASLLATAAHADLKVGYVDLQRALIEVSEGQVAKARLKTEMDKKKAELDAEQAKLTDDKAVLDKQGAMMSEEVRTQKFTEWQKRLYDVMQKAQKVQMDLQEKERTELKKIFERMDPIIAAIAQREGLTMVFEKTDSGLVYAPPSLDLTNELVRTYNEKHPAKSGGGVGAPKKDAAPKEAPKDAPKQ
ncbi:MAG: OmpH family outer membrane protein [Myxococcaceae bacterium]|nr:OmpH family outer membrane protein [Myxococcaceae bacterium]